MDLAEDSLKPVSARVWAIRVAAVLLAAALIAAIAMWARGLGDGSKKPRQQVAKIALLPDTPPPPPPKEEPKKPPPPKEDARPEPREVPKVADVPKPAAEPLKMEGAAGDGPSNFAAGSVKDEYRAGAPQIGASGPAGAPVDRANERFYASTARQLLRDGIEKHLPSDAGELTATFSIWVDPEGRIARFEVADTGDRTRDGAMEGALDRARRDLRLPPPGALAQPMRFRLTARSQT